MFSFMKNEESIREFAYELMGKKLKESNDGKKTYKSDDERRELVREYRAASEKNDEKRAREIMEILFSEVEMAIYNLANSLSSGGRSRRSGADDYGSTHNDAEELKSIGVIGFIRTIDGSEVPDGNGGMRKAGFNPDGPGTFLGFVLKAVEGYMKNAHTREKAHFGLEKTSLDAPRDEDGDINLYNDIFPDSDARFDKLINDSDYEDFLESDAFYMLIDCLGDVVNSQREEEVFKHYYGIDGFKMLTPTQLGEKYGVSKQRIDQMREKTLKKLREYFRKERENKTEITENTSEETNYFDGKNQRVVRNELPKIASPIFKGFFTDEYWAPIQSFFEKLGELNIKYNLIKSEYHHNEQGEMSSKRWSLEFPFINHTGKEFIVYGTIVASGAGTIENPLGRYDVTFTCF